MGRQRGLDPERLLDGKVTNPIVLSPYTTKRLQKLLENVLGQYESRFGK